MNQDNISFDLPKDKSNVIKVIGVGGGGSNAVNYMFNQGIADVDFVICNTDSQALNNSSVPNKIQLGVTLTEGLGAGANPVIGGQSAEESIEEIKVMLSTNTKMIFLTAGMGGGTGTGAAPVIAKLASELDILTVGIITIPFAFEGKKRLEQAQKGVEELRKHVDSLIVINNNKLREIYGNLGYKSGFAKADEILATAAKSITNVITEHYGLNIDLHDAKTVLSNSGTAIMGSAEASGENRAIVAVNKALDSPLLNDNKITGAKNVLLLIVSGVEEITIDEMGEINDFINDESGGTANVILGLGDNPELGERISITVVATGFPSHQQDGIIDKEPSRTVHVLNEEKNTVKPLITPPVEEKKVEAVIKEEPAIVKKETKAVVEDKKVVHQLGEEVEEISFALPKEEEKVVEEEKVETLAEIEKVEEEIEDTTIAFKELEKEVDVVEDTVEELIEVEEVAEIEETPAYEKAEEETEAIPEEIISENDNSEDPQTSIEFEFDIIDNSIEYEDNSIDEEEVVEEEEKKVVHRLEDFEKDIIDELDYVNSMNLDEEVAPEEEKVSEEPELKIELKEEVKEEVKEEEVVSKVELKEHVQKEDQTSTFSDGSKRYNLNDYTNLEEKIASAKPVAEIEEEEEEIVPELNFTLKQKLTEEIKKENESKEITSIPFEREVEDLVDPTDVPLSKKDQIGIDRRQRLRKFNHRFKESTNANIDEIEKQPAYKRAGIDVSSTPLDSTSRYSLGQNEENVVIKSNNSFLHDNVD